MQIKQDQQGVYIERVVQWLNEEGETVNTERNEFRGFKTIEEAHRYAEKWIADRWIQEDIEVLPTA